MNETEAWIRERYGPITIKQTTFSLDVLRVQVFVAFVPVMNGTAIGVGTTREAALDALKTDLTIP